MATVNKASLRTEFDALKARFESLCAEGKMSAESRALFDALLMLFELLMAVFMEKHTPKSPANSGLPPSQSPNDATARTRPGAKGKGPSYNEARCANTRTREHVRVLAAVYIRALMANKGVAGTTRCRAGRQDAASRQASSRLLRCAPALRVTRPNVLTHRVFMAGSELPATSRPICENTSSPEVNPHILCSPFIRGFSQPPTAGAAQGSSRGLRVLACLARDPRSAASERVRVGNGRSDSGRKGAVAGLRSVWPLRPLHACRVRKGVELRVRVEER